MVVVGSNPRNCGSGPTASVPCLPTARLKPSRLKASARSFDSHTYFRTRKALLAGVRGRLAELDFSAVGATLLPASREDLVDALCGPARATR
jgi:hypothetical protein